MYQKKRDKRSIQSSEWMYEALKELMEVKDYSKITVTDITNKANLGRTTFYRNFETIDDVLEMKCIEKFKEFRQYCIDFYKLNDIEVKSFLKPFLMYWYDNSEVIELLIKANRDNIIKKYLTKEVQFFVDISSINKDTVISSHINYFIEMRVSNSISILTEWIKNDKNIPPDELANIISTQTKESIEVNLFL
ncbi:TetR/AcrR family transcriptional regulator [Paraclostridium bifermentans]|uniref:TetR/AcrR family transcriptional regulator n=1 Tax=Paraclostridium bifermentans TaxID=1490 RepID=UPI00359C670F